MPKSLSPLRYPGWQIKNLLQDKESNALGNRTYVEPFVEGFG